MRSTAFAARVLAGLTLAAVAAPAALAQDRPQGPLQPIRDSDPAMTCTALADEAARLSAEMGGKPGPSIFDRLGGVARTGVAMLVPGAGLAIAGADALTQPERQRREAEALAGQNRWYYLNGVYAGRRCHELAEAPPAPAKSVTPAPAATVQPAVAAMPPAPAVVTAAPID